MALFQYYAPTKVVFGRSAEAQTGALISAFGGEKVLIHYGGGSVVRSGLLNRVTASLDAEGISHVELGGVVPNPHVSLVYKGIELARRENVDFILAVGGGSVIDSSKAIAYGVYYDGDVWDLFSGAGTASACLPVGVVLTLAATGSEMSNSTALSNEQLGLKRGYNNDISRPKFAVMNPELLITLPEYQTFAGCADIMMHTMERYLNGCSTNMEMTDTFAEGLIRTVMKNALILKKEPDNYQARAEVMWAGSLSHSGLTGFGTDGGDWMPHKLSHEIGSMFDKTHGAILTALWGSWARHAAPANYNRFAKLARQVMGVFGSDETETALLGIEAMVEFFRSIGMPVTLKELGIEPTPEQMRQMAHQCASGVGGQGGSICRLTEEDMYGIYVNALG